MMMGLDERVFYFIVGLLLGAVIGFISRTLLDIYRKVDRMEKNEKGAIRLPKWRIKDWALFAVLVVVALSAFQSQRVSNQVVENSEETQANSARDSMVTDCVVSSFTDLLNAVNERTTYSIDQSNANIALQNAQSLFIANALQEPPLDPPRVEEALTQYFAAISEFVTVQNQTLEKQLEYSYPTAKQLEACIDKTRE